MAIVYKSEIRGLLDPDVRKEANLSGTVVPVVEEGGRPGQSLSGPHKGVAGFQDCPSARQRVVLTGEAHREQKYQKENVERTSSLREMRKTAGLRLPLECIAVRAGHSLRRGRPSSRTLSVVRLPEHAPSPMNPVLRRSEHGAVLDRQTSISGWLILTSSREESRDVTRDGDLPRRDRFVVVSESEPDVPPRSPAIGPRISSGYWRQESRAVHKAASHLVSLSADTEGSHRKPCSDCLRSCPRSDIPAFCCPNRPVTLRGSYPSPIGKSGMREISTQAGSGCRGPPKVSGTVTLITPASPKQFRLKEAMTGTPSPPRSFYKPSSVQTSSIPHDMAVLCLEPSGGILRLVAGKPQR
ncbi:hypothetical protein C8R47DRAFT_1067801 [Mycena vitilis]|nr:hypothetical protein C8R47DRAFT_1067801 [Mycena vitilis]